jgi:glycosyltransferase involved in cell wall biosynthesis
VPSVSVVAPTYRRRDALPGFLEPVLREAADEVVIAVDGSDDGSVEWLRERARDDGRLVVLDLPNGGAGAARQAGLEAATGDVVVLLDDDVIVSPGLVAGHARHHEALEPKLVLGYMPNDWRAVAPDRRAVAWIYRDAYEQHCARYRTDPAFVLTGMWGGNLSMPRRDMLRVGIAKLAVRRGQDDREFGVRCLKAGVEGVFDPSLQALHLYDRSFDAYRRDCRIQGESRRLVGEAHGDVVGGGLGDLVGTGLPAPVRAVWPALARDPLFGPLSAALDAAYRAAVRQHHLGLEVFVARGLGSLEVMRGVIDA